MVGAKVDGCQPSGHHSKVVTDRTDVIRTHFPPTCHLETPVHRHHDVVDMELLIVWHGIAYGFIRAKLHNIVILETKVLFMLDHQCKCALPVPSRMPILGSPPMNASVTGNIDTAKVPRVQAKPSCTKSCYAYIERPEHLAASASHTLEG